MFFLAFYFIKINNYGSYLSYSDAFVQPSLLNEIIKLNIIEKIMLGTYLLQIYDIQFINIFYFILISTTSTVSKICNELGIFTASISWPILWWLHTNNKWNILISIANWKRVYNLIQTTTHHCLHIASSSPMTWKSWHEFTKQIRPHGLARSIMYAAFDPMTEGLLI